MQARSLFVTAFAALVAVAFAKKSEEARSAKVSDVAAYTALGLAVISFLLDVNMRDLSNKQVSVRDGLRNTAISSVRPDDLRWYQIDQARIDSLFEDAYSNRSERKLALVLTPNLEQAVFYFLPIGVLFAFRVYGSRQGKRQRN